MYKTNAEKKSTRTDLIEVEMNGKKDDVDIYIRNAKDAQILQSAGIHLSPEGFTELVVPILNVMGYTMVPTPEGM